MDRENLSQFLDNTIRTCREQALAKGLSEEETQKMLNYTLMQFYKILEGYTNGRVDSETHELFVQKSPEFGAYLEDLEQQEKARVEQLRKEELQKRFAQIDTELGTSKTVTRSESKTTSTRETQEDPCSHRRGGGRC